jgi:2-oxoisovalerate dehydrogenase E2 component (dihydrolipoyl transacylase)
LALEIKMPQLGESVTEGTITKWLVKPGDVVKKYQPLAEVVTDKVNAEIPAPAGGTIQQLLVEENKTVPVGTLIATMVEEGAAAAAAPAAAGPAPGAAAPAAAPTATPAAAPAAAPAAGVGLAVAKNAPAGGRYSPAVLKLAQEHGVDLTQVTGTGLGGRITRKDVEAFVAAGLHKQAAPAAVATPAAPVAAPAAPAAAAPAAPPAPKAPAGVVTAAGDTVIPVTPVRRAIANRMLQSKHEAPHAWTMVQADVTGLVKLREQIKGEFQKREGINLSFMPFFIKAVTDSLKEYPIINSQWNGDSIVIKKDINISIAVATEDALVVPVIKNADRLSISGLMHAVVDLASRARANKLGLDDIQGGTFTVNNTGYFGSVVSQPIINYPQAAILSFEAIVKQPVVLENDAIAIRHMMNLCMSLDHRILDGLVCGRFLQAVKQRLESYAPGMML